MLMILARLVCSESFWAVVKVRSPHTGPEVCYIIAPNHGGRAAAARTLRHNANRARPSTGKHTPRLGHTAPRARERGWLLAREESFRDPLQDHARIIPRPGGRRDCNQSSRAACRSLGRLGRRGGEQGTQL